jgi:hypothetical protein
MLRARADGDRGGDFCCGALFRYWHWAAEERCPRLRRVLEGKRTHCLAVPSTVSEEPEVECGEFETGAMAAIPTVRCKVCGREFRPIRVVGECVTLYVKAVVAEIDALQRDLLGNRRRKTHRTGDVDHQAVGLPGRPLDPERPDADAMLLALARNLAK